MTNDEAWAALGSERRHDRLLAARHLAQHATAADRERLIAALQGESVTWVRSALEQAVRRASGGASPAAIATAPWDEAPPDNAVYARAMRETTARILHEMNSLFGLLRVSATREVEGYEESKTRRHLDRLGRLLGAIDKLGQAAEPPQIELFDLAGLIQTVAEAARTHHGQSVGTEGSTPCSVQGDPALVDLVVANALRNAIEAEQTAGVAGTVVVSWGVTDVDVWVSVLDRGVGLPPAASSAFDMGTSTKREQGHVGMGLAIAEQAAQSLLGRVTLVPRDGGGTAFELRWPRELGGDV